FGFAENTDDLFVGKTLLHGDLLMWLMKTLLTSGCTNQRGAGQTIWGMGRESGSDQSEHRWHQHSAAMHPVVDTMAFADTVTWYLLYLRFSVGLKP
ncbi:hypothetical protein LAX19_23085, partial [Escherichia coli]|nr:hypothetical protein [Escherichia coli]